MKRILIVAYYYPPLATSGAMRPLAFSRFLLERGWQPSVLSADPPPAARGVDVDPALNERIPPSVRVLRVPYQLPLGRIRGFLGAVRSRKRADAKDPPPSSAADRPSDGSARLTDAVLERLFGFPDLCAPWIKPAVRSALREFRREPPDVVLATAPPWSSLLVGHRIASSLGVPLVIDFRDPWTGNPLRRTRSAWAARRAERLEAELVERAALVITNTEEGREQLTHLYPNASPKVRTITNGYDPELMPPDSRAARLTEHPVELLHLGTIYGQRSPLELLLALEALNEKWEGELRSALRIRFVGGWELEDSRINALADQLERAGVIVRMPTIPHDQCLEMMARAPVLLVLQPASPVQIPGKLYEYVASGRPILLVGGEGATARLVDHHGLGVCTPNTRECIAESLIRLIRHPESVPPPPRDEVARFSYRLLTGRLAEALDGLETFRARWANGLGQPTLASIDAN